MRGRGEETRMKEKQGEKDGRKTYLGRRGKRE